MAASPKILFIHDNFPAQFGEFGQWLAGLGWDVTFATAKASARSEDMRILRYGPHRTPSAQTHPYAQPMDRAAINGQGFARVALAARRGGYRPDIIVAHSGWGSGMFARDVFPQARFVAYCEWWYRHPGVDTAYLAQLTGREAVGSPDAPMHERARNAPIAMDIAASDAAVCPAHFQAAQFPDPLRRALTVQHDGIDTDYYRPDPAALRSTLGGLVAEDAHVVTYATRGMEPHRGFPQFMASLPRILAADSKSVAVIAGENRVAYGGDGERKIDWKARALKENDLDPSRVRFVGTLARDAYRELLRRADAHVYLTVPFVLSWSMLEAMSAGCALVLSDTEPVREFAGEDEALLVDMSNSAAISEAVLEAVCGGGASQIRRLQARERVRLSLSIREIFQGKATFLNAL